MEKRADSLMDLVDAISSTERVSSPVALSEVKPAFRRKFSSVYDVLRHAAFDEGELRQVLRRHLPSECQEVAGYEVYVLDATFLERGEAKTLADRRCLRRGADAAVEYGHKYSWLVRMVEASTSWVAPMDIERITSQQSDVQVGVLQIQRLCETTQKVIVADGSYGNGKFLRPLVGQVGVSALVRLRHNRRLYELPAPETEKRRGAKRKHGKAFKLNAPPRSADRRAEQVLPDGRTLRVQAWQGLHLRDLAEQNGMVLRLDLFRPDGSPCYKRPTFVFWTGDPNCDLLTLAGMYLWRFGIEHAFRFMKQQLGLNRCRSTDLPSLKRWMWCCLLAYWQLLLLRNTLHLERPAWYPQRPNLPSCATPRLVQRNAGRILDQLGTPAQAPKPSGKGLGRPHGYHPAPRQRFNTVPTRRQLAAPVKIMA
jgi:hypothetical protein